MCPYICFEKLIQETIISELCMVDAVSHVIFRVFYILHVRSVLKPSGLLLGIWTLILEFLLPATITGKTNGWVEDTDCTGGLPCPVYMVRSWSAWQCHVSCLWDVLFSLKNEVCNRRNSNTSGSGLSGDMENGINLEKPLEQWCFCCQSLLFCTVRRDTCSIMLIFQHHIKCEDVRKGL